MGICQSKSDDTDYYIKKHMYNYALYTALDNKLKYIKEHSPYIHGNFDVYLSKLNDEFDKELCNNYYNLSISMNATSKKT